MKLLFVLENYPPHYGGIEVVFQNTCERLAKTHDVTVLTHRVPGTQAKETVNGVNIRRIPHFGFRHAFPFIAPFFTQQADLVHTTTFNSAPAGWLIAKLLRKPVVLTVHETWLGKWKDYTTMTGVHAWWHNFLERCIFTLRYDRYLCVSNATARRLREVLPNQLHSRIVVNHNGFDYALWKKQNTKQSKKRLGVNGFVVLGYGRPGHAKGFAFLAKAFPLLLKKIRAHLVLILSKDTAFEEEYDHILRLLDPVQKHVTVLHPVPYNKLPAYVSMADCVVVPSLAEGFGYTTVEANALGIPVVATNVGSIPEVISGKHVLVPPKNAKAIADGIMQVQKKRYKTTPRKTFTWNAHIKRLKNIYEELL